MTRRFCLSTTIVLALTPLAWAAISAASPLSNILADNPYIFVAKIESVDAANAAMVATVQDDLKGTFPYRRLAVVLNGDADAKEFDHLPKLHKRIAAGESMVWFVLPRGKKLNGFAYINGTWMQIPGQVVDKDRTVWTFAHLEPNLRQAFKGTTAEMIQVVRDAVAGTKPPPPQDKNELPGFGPELPRKELPRKDSHRGPVRGLPAHPAALFAVIPTIGILGPVAILAVLFPTIFGGVLILFRQWTAFITAFSLNSLLYLLYWWKGSVWFRGTWWNTEAGIWFVLSAVTLVCFIWAWRRQLRNLTLGIDFVETPTRTEFVVLGLLTLGCVGFVVVLPMLAPVSRGDVAWNYTLVLTAAIVAGLWYKAFRTFFETPLPMATEGVMLGVGSLSHLAIFAMLTASTSAAIGGTLGTSAPGASGPGDGPRPEFVRQAWTFETAETGLFVSSPLAMGGRVYAASAHPTFKGGTLYCLDLRTGKESWNFIDDGDLKQVYSSPAYADGRIYVGEGFHEDPSCKLYCVDAKTGEKVWTHTTTSQTEATPAVAGGKVYQGCGNDGFFCLAAEGANRGQVLWQYPPTGAKGRLLRFGAGAVVRDGRVYVGTGVDRLRKDDPGETLFVCLDAETGREIWKLPMPQPVWAAPAVDGEIFVATGTGDVFSDGDAPAGSLFCLSPAGAIVWKAELPKGILQQPAIGDGIVYVGCRDGHVYAFDRNDGRQVWKHDLESPVVARPVLVRSATGDEATSLFAVGTKGKLVCLDPVRGERFWWYDVIGPKEMTFCAAPAVAVTPTPDGERRRIILGAGDVTSGARATLLCFEDRR